MSHCVLNYKHKCTHVWHPWRFTCECMDLHYISCFGGSATFGVNNRINYIFFSKHFLKLVFCLGQNITILLYFPNVELYMIASYSLLNIIQEKIIFGASAITPCSRSGHFDPRIKWLIKLVKFQLTPNALNKYKINWANLKNSVTLAPFCICTCTII